MRSALITAYLFAAATGFMFGDLRAAPIKAKPKAPISNAPARLYDFKGVPLEISLEDFRKLPQPDGNPARTVCTGEKVGSTYPTEPVDVMVFDDVEKGLGVVKCQWISVGGGYSDGWPSGLAIVDSGYATNHYSYSFIRDPKDGVMRLFEFEGQTNIAAFDAAVEALTNKYGKPTMATSTVHNKLGTAFDQTTATWANPVSSLMVQSRWSKTDDMGFLMLDQRLFAIVKAAREQKKASIKTPI